MSTARKLDRVRIPSDQRLPDDVIEVDDEGREGVVLSPEDEEELERAIAEAKEDERAGRLIPADVVRAKLRCSA